MFAARYFAPHYFPQRYFAPGASGVGPALAAPALAYAYSTPASIRLTFGTPTGGAGGYVINVHRSTTSGFTPSGVAPGVGTCVAANVASPYDDATGLAQLVKYYYRLVVVDALGDTATSNQVSEGLAYDGSVVGGGGPGTGTGGTAVDHDGGAGVLVDGGASTSDVLRYVRPDGTGAPDLTVAAYDATLYDAATPAENVAGITTTGADGRWAEPLMLDPGVYVIVADAPGDGFYPRLATVEVP